MGRVIIIVLDSFGVGYEPDAAEFGDVGANTLKSIYSSPWYETPVMESMGLFNIDGIDYAKGVDTPIASFGRLQEASKGKDTTTGHWEIAGLVSAKPMPTYPDGFPEDLMEELSRRTGRGYLCNKPYSGTKVINDYGDEHLETGKLIIYTSADSVLQIAAHEDLVPVPELYRYCEIARELLQGEHGVGRVIARPFIGTSGNYTRTTRRHDYSLVPPRNTMMDVLVKNGMDTYGVGKIYDIFAGKNVNHTVRIVDSIDGMIQTEKFMQEDFDGLCFVNLVDFDMVYGHRRDIDGYAWCANIVDRCLKHTMSKMKPDDVLMITADHGCDPGFTGTDHTREYIPLLVYGESVKPGVNIGTRPTFADIAATVQDILGVAVETEGTSFWPQIRKD